MHLEDLRIHLPADARARNDRRGYGRDFAQADVLHGDHGELEDFVALGILAARFQVNEDD
jgi:hypothetical protein